MPRPLKPRQQRENARFLEALARTGNVRIAARSLGVNRSTYTKRRAQHPAFAAAWDAALAAARPHRRRPRAAGITPEVDAALLEHLREGWSLRLAAENLGFAHASFLARARADPAFAHELKVAAAIGRDRLLLDHMDRVAAGPPERARPNGPLPRMTWEEALHRLHLANPDGRFQRYVERRRRAAPRKPLAFYAPRIRAKFAALMRRGHYQATGRWRFDDE